MARPRYVSRMSSRSACGLNSAVRNRSMACRTYSSVGSPPPSTSLMRSENSAVSDCTSSGSPTSSTVSPRTVIREANASCTTWRISSAGPTMSAMFTLRGAVRVIWVWSVMGALYHARPARASMSSNRQGNIVQVIKICRERRGGSRPRRSRLASSPRKHASVSFSVFYGRRRIARTRTRVLRPAGRPTAPSSGRAPCPRPRLCSSARPSTDR